VDGGWCCSPGEDDTHERGFNAKRIRRRRGEERAISDKFRTRLRRQRYCESRFFSASPSVPPSFKPQLVEPPSLSAHPTDTWIEDSVSPPPIPADTLVVSTMMHNIPHFWTVWSRAYVLLLFVCAGDIGYATRGGEMYGISL
jgi:hypothetical protein